ncbi:L,D-transpeptidase family protein [Alkalinema pantanalense CENA528]|uniref:L,D-transpeptidase n=1 Tax=Alkalinema pantanalense TaxID=1620705 RepID=UPI003D6E418D
MVTCSSSFQRRLACLGLRLLGIGGIALIMMNVGLSRTAAQTASPIATPSSTDAPAPNPSAPNPSVTDVPANQTPVAVPVESPSQISPNSIFPSPVSPLSIPGLPSTSTEAPIANPTAETPPPVPIPLTSPTSTTDPTPIEIPTVIPAAIEPTKPAVPFGHLPVDEIWEVPRPVEPSIAPNLSPDIPILPTPPGDTNPTPQSPPSTIPSMPVQSIEEPIHLIVRRGKRRVEVYRGKTQLASYPIAVGKAGWETPIGDFTVINKEENPIFKSFKTGNVIEPGPDNPLGVRWIGIWTDGKTQIGFHGTNQPELIGKAVSHGCIRMRNKDVIALYQYVTVGTPVTVKP